MTALHFETTYRDGTIFVPSEYRELMQQQVEIVVLMKPVIAKPKQAIESVQEEENFIEYMIRNPKKIDDFEPMSREEIYDR